jgi:hypothetical protein
MSSLRDRHGRTIWFQVWALLLIGQLETPREAGGVDTPRTTAGQELRSSPVGILVPVEVCQGSRCSGGLVRLIPSFEPQDPSTGTALGQHNLADVTAVGEVRGFLAPLIWKDTVWSPRKTLLT